MTHCCCLPYQVAPDDHDAGARGRFEIETCADCPEHGTVARSKLAPSSSKSGGHETRERRAIRREVAEEIAQALEARYADSRRLALGDSDIIPRDARIGIATGYQRAARIAREIGSKEASND